MIRIALDSNVLIYGAGIARGPADEAKVVTIERLIKRLSDEGQVFVSTQALGETFNVAVKAGLTRIEAQKVIAQYVVLFTPIAPNLGDFQSSVELAARHQLQIWDSLILSSASSIGCTWLLSEDMQDGFTWRGVTILNPLGERAEQALFG